MTENRPLLSATANTATLPARDENLPIGPRDTPVMTRLEPFVARDGRVEHRRRVRIGQRVGAEDGVLEERDVVGVDGAVFVDIAVRKQP